MCNQAAGWPICWGVLECFEHCSQQQTQKQKLRKREQQQSLLLLRLLRLALCISCLSVDGCCLLLAFLVFHFPSCVVQILYKMRNWNKVMRPKNFTYVSVSGIVGGSSENASSLHHHIALRGLELHLTAAAVWPTFPTLCSGLAAGMPAPSPLCSLQ